MVYSSQANELYCLANSVYMIFYKKHVYKKHEAEIRQKFRNI